MTFVAEIEGLLGHRKFYNLRPGMAQVVGVGEVCLRSQATGVAFGDVTIISLTPLMYLTMTSVKALLFSIAFQTRDAASPKPEHSHSL